MPTFLLQEKVSVLFPRTDEELYLFKSIQHQNFEGCAQKWEFHQPSTFPGSDKA